MKDREYNRTSPFISNSLHYSSDFYPYLGEFAYICRGFKGNLTRLNELFEIHQVILDASLSSGYRERLIKECQLLKISYTDLSVCGSYSVVL